RPVREPAGVVAFRPDPTRQRAPDVNPRLQQVEDTAEVIPGAPAQLPPRALVDVHPVDRGGHPPTPPGPLPLLAPPPPPPPPPPAADPLGAVEGEGGAGRGWEGGSSGGCGRGGSGAGGLCRGGGGGRRPRLGDRPAGRGTRSP